MNQINFASLPKSSRWQSCTRVHMKLFLALSLFHTVLGMATAEGAAVSCGSAE